MEDLKDNALIWIREDGAQMITMTVAGLSKALSANIQRQEYKGEFKNENNK